MTLTRRHCWLHITAVALVACACYVNSLWNGFALDDNFIVLGNSRVHQLSDQGQIWLTPYWTAYGKSLGLYRPLAIFGYALQWAAADGKPWIFHAVNVLLHAGVSVLAWVLLMRMGSPAANTAVTRDRATDGNAAVPSSTGNGHGWLSVTPAGALIGALIFAVHPLHTEVVANVVGQAELIAAAAVLAICAIHAGRPAGPGIGYGRLLLILLLFGIGMLAKEGAVVAPGLLVAIDVAQGRVRLSRPSIGRYLGRMGGPFAFMATTLLAYMLLRFSVLDSIGGADAAPSLPFLRDEGRVFSALRAWPEYVRLIFFPLDLTADYSPGVVLPVTTFTPMVILGALLLIGTIGLALATPVRPAVGVPAAWFLIAVFPVSNLVMPIGVLLAERVLYLPSVAVAFIAAFAWPALVERTARRRWLAPALAALVIVAFGARSFIRNADWKSTHTVWEALVRDRPESYRSQWINALYASERGDEATALAYKEIAYRIWPDDPALLNEIAAAYLANGQPQRAIPLLERALEIADYLEQTPARIAYAYLGLRRYEDALEATLHSTRVGFDPVTTLTLRAQAYEGLQRHDWAAGTWRVVASRRAGRLWTTWAMLARSLARLGDSTAGLAAADTAIRLTPDDATAVRHDIEQLRDAIGRGCFGGASSHTDAPIDRPSSCHDPLQDWPFLTARNAKEVATALQNATSRAGSGVGSGSRRNE